MRVLLVSQHYAPEVTAASARVAAFATGLVERGHRVEVITEIPTHPAGLLAPGYRRRGERRTVDGVDVRYVWVRTRPEKTTAGRLLTYGTFAASATAAGTFSRRADIVIATSPPLPVGAVGRAIALRHRAPFVLDVRDLWPEAAVVLGELRGERAIRAAERLERGLYRAAAAIVTTTEPFGRRIEARGGEGKVTVIANGTTREWLSAGEAAPDREAADLPADEFVWAYGGNLGLAQGLEAAIEAAAELGDGFRLLLLGEGPRREALRKLADGLPAARVEFRPLVPAPQAAAILRACDALLVPLDARPELAQFIPSKLFDCLALGRPVIVAAEGEPRRLVEERDAGLPVPPGDPGALADAVRRLRADSGLASRLSERARELAAVSLREAGTERLERLLSEVAAG